MEISPILIPISAIVGVFGTAILLRKFENDERMAMIEKGLNPYLPKPRQPKQPKSNAMITFHFAAIAIGVSIGLIMGNILERNVNMNNAVAYFSMILLFGGLGLLVSYSTQLKYEEKERERNRKAEKQYSDVPDIDL